MPPEIELPAVPALVLVLINLLSPWAIAVVNQARWSASAKRLISIALSAALTVVALALYYGYTGEPIPNWPLLVILGILVSQTSYAAIAKPLGAKAIEEATSASKPGI